jgi:hypothetical protein
VVSGNVNTQEEAATPDRKHLKDEHKLLDALETFAGMASVSTNEALKMIGDSDWDEVWEMQDLILDIVVASEKLSSEDVATFKTDETAWKKELKFFYDEFQKQATDQNKAEKEL